MSLYYKMAQSIRGDRIADIPELFNQDNINTVEKIIANIASREILTVCVTYYFTLKSGLNKIKNVGVCGGFIHPHEDSA